MHLIKLQPYELPERKVILNIVMYSDAFIQNCVFTLLLKQFLFALIFLNWK